MTASRSSRQVMLPIRLGIDPMERLLVASFRGDPEFEALEPQVFDDPVNGRGMRVLRYRKDGKVDVYWQRGVRVDSGSFVIGNGLGDFMESRIEPAVFEITPRGVDLDVAFVDSQGRTNQLRIREDAVGKRGFPLLAPVGADIEEPLQLFLVYMPDIDLVRRAGSLVEGRIGDRAVRPASLPILLRGRRVHFIRYVARPTICTLNPPMNRPVIAELSVPGVTEVDGMSVVADAGAAITRIAATHGGQRVEVDFHPGFPNLLGLIDGGTAAGRWSIRILGLPITGGSYRAARDGPRVAVALDVTDHWRPSGLPLSMELFTRLIRKFRTWPSTYRWRGVVKLGGEPAMSGTWERVGRPTRRLACGRCERLRSRCTAIAVRAVLPPAPSRRRGDAPAGAGGVDPALRRGPEGCGLRLLVRDPQGDPLGAPGAVGRRSRRGRSAARRGGAKPAQSGSARPRLPGSTSSRRIRSAFSGSSKTGLWAEAANE